MLAQRWGQQLACSLGKVKSLFSAMWQAEQQENNNNNKNTRIQTSTGRSTTYGKRRSRVDTSSTSVKKKKNPTLQDAQLVHFSKLYAGPLSENP